jgi:hypothetical protein
MADIETQSLLYHLTDIANLENILTDGLKPRSELQGFSDVADHEILDKRKKLDLENYVPFHFYGRNPFDGGVQVANPDKSFVLITVTRALARDNNWKVIPRHPLADDDIALMDYDEGFAAIDWAKMNEREYNDPESKSVCMAECLSPNTVASSRFLSIFVKDAAIESEVRKLLDKAGVSPHLNINSTLFV